jgi:antitoxin component HigA of HigAB toxin-antitoxin module
MDINSIQNEADHRATLREIETLMTATAGSSEGDRLEVLVTLVEAYERTHFPMDPHDPSGDYPVQNPHKRTGQSLETPANTEI